ncbi:hypothetical protein [Calothrix sp. NIES-3974]|uniref:hypothetical protein n=1 Tax=Calothrix sp. NIES-3974 TaxID=2005462 RepID=UPI000BBBAE54|nr:hypothetical protein [Calothrix sp. NIES-3974]
MDFEDSRLLSKNPILINIGCNQFGNNFSFPQGKTQHCRFDMGEWEKIILELIPDGELSHTGEDNASKLE